MNDLLQQIHDEIERCVAARAMFKLKPFMATLGYENSTTHRARFRKAYGSNPKALYLKQLAAQPKPPRKPRPRAGHEEAMKQAIDAAVTERRLFCVTTYLRDRGVSGAWVCSSFRKHIGISPRAYYIGKLADRVRELQAESPSTRLVWLIMRVLPEGSSAKRVDAVRRALLQAEQSKAA